MSQNYRANVTRNKDGFFTPNNASQNSLPSSQADPLAALLSASPRRTASSGESVRQRPVVDSSSTASSTNSRRPSSPRSNPSALNTRSEVTSRSASRGRVMERSATSVNPNSRNSPPLSASSISRINVTSTNNPKPSSPSLPSSSVRAPLIPGNSSSIDRSRERSRDRARRNPSSENLPKSATTSYSSSNNRAPPKSAPITTADLSFDDYMNDLEQLTFNTPAQPSSSGSNSRPRKNLPPSSNKPLKSSTSNLSASPPNNNRGYRAEEERKMRIDADRISSRQDQEENRRVIEARNADRTAFSSNRSRTTSSRSAPVASFSTSNDEGMYMIEKEEPLDESIIVPEYVQALIQTLKTDPIPSPNPDDFLSSDGYNNWKYAIGGPFQKVLCDLLYSKYLDKAGRTTSRKSTTTDAKVVVVLYFKIVQARGLLAKEKRTRDAYCVIEFGDFNIDVDTDYTSKKAKESDTILSTEVVPDSLSPSFNQHMKIPVKNLTDRVKVSVFDARKQEMLGCVKLNVGELVTICAKEGFLRKWYPLLPNNEKKAGKYVGGEILLELSLADDETQKDTSTPMEYLQSQLLACKVNFKSLYQILLRNTLILDMNTLGQISDAVLELLTEESKTLLRIFARMWAIGEAYQVIAYLELLFEKYKKYAVPYSAIMHVLDTVHQMKKRSGWISSVERPILLSLLEEMHEYYKTQVTKYREFYPKNLPKGALNTTILMLRMISKNPIFQEAHTELPGSFREELKGVMTVAAVARYERNRELSLPFDETDTEGVVDGLYKLAELLSEEIEDDAKYFQKAFAKEFDIVRLTADSYLKYLVLTLESNHEIIASDEAVDHASKTVFALYKKLKEMDDRYSKLIPGLKRLSMSAGFNVERWFHPFISNWLEHLSHRTLEWVNNATAQDNFLALESEDDEMKHSSSIVDLFSIIFQELEFIMDLGWSNVVQNAIFFQKFSKTVNNALEQYCDSIFLGESKVDTPGGMTAWLQKSNNGNETKDINEDSCVKLCNINYAVQKLDEMYKMMNAASLNKSVRDYRATMAPSSRNSKKDDEEKMRGQLKIQIAYSENLKPCNNNGKSNPYVVIKVPEGTEVPPVVFEDEVFDGDTKRPGSIMSKSSGGGAGPAVLNGKDCELAKSRVIYDSLNPTWDETFQTILPPVTNLEVSINSYNYITSDDPVGHATIDLSRSSRLRRKLADHQTHDVYIELEPQGRLVARFTIEGTDEDVDFWFRRSRERLGRTRDAFVRGLTARIAPNAKAVLSKIFKDNEAAAVSTSFFSSLTQAVQYTDKTASGASITQQLNANEADSALAPLTDYLNKNLETLCKFLSTKMAQEVIKRTWDETLLITEQFLIPTLYGQIERDRKVLNKRQVSAADWTLKILKDFFYADGGGLSNRILETRKYADLLALINQYSIDFSRLKRDYELSLLSGREKEYLLRLIRFRIEKEDDFKDKDDAKKWFDNQLVKRRERK